MKKTWSAFATIGLVAVLSFTAITVVRADESGEASRAALQTNNKAQVIRADDTNILRLTPDKTKVIRLDQDASSVIVTNPAHAAVLLDSPRTLIVMPRQPGSTAFTVLNNKGETIMAKDIIITAAQPQYIRVRRMCGLNDSSCQASSYFYCPDGCYEVSPVAPAEGEQKVPPIAGGTPTSFDPPVANQQTADEAENGEVGDDTNAGDE